MDALVRNLIFCSSCDYVMDKLERDSLRCRPDAVTCPRCHAVNLTQFYSYGSQTHRDRRDAWERGGIKGAPLPFPNADHQERCQASPPSGCSAKEGDHETV